MYHVYRIHIPLFTYCKFSARKIRLASLFDEVGSNSLLNFTCTEAFYVYVLHIFTYDIWIISGCNDVIQGL